MNLKVGDQLVYPHHGAVTVTELKSRIVRETKKNFVQFRVHHDGLMIEVPTDNAEAVGVRKAIGAKGVKELTGILREPVSMDKEMWAQRFKRNQGKIVTGDIYQVGEVVRDLTRRTEAGKTSAGEKRQLEEATRILTSELALSLGTDNDGAQAFIDQTLGAGPAQEPVLVPVAESAPEPEAASAAG